MNTQVADLSCCHADAHLHGVSDIVASPCPQQGSSCPVYDCAQHATVNRERALAGVGLLVVSEACVLPGLDQELVHRDGKEAAEAAIPSKH